MTTIARDADRQERRAVMRSNAARAAIAIGAIAVVVVLFVVLNGDDSDNGSSNSTTATQPAGGTGATGSRSAGGNGEQAKQPELKPPVTIVVRDGKPVGGVKRLEYKKDEHVRLVVESDVTDEIHVHGYDRSTDVQAGGTARLDFKANLEGVFEIELESRGEQIAELRVTPS
jgi:hypothetical protein